MNTQQKIEKLFDLLTGRFGEFEYKAGQNPNFVKRGWEIEFGKYEWDDLKAAYTLCASKAKYERWPTQEEFATHLKDFAVKPERDPFEHMSGDWKTDFGYFCAWWDTIPLVYTDDGIRRDDILRHFVGRHHGSFADMCVRAWRKGVSHNWAAAHQSYANEMRRGFDLYRRMKAARGEVFANTHKLTHDEQEKMLGKLLAENSPTVAQLEGEYNQGKQNM